ncbi:MAG: hypothetical protein NXI03_02905 [Alphaproteobacteria bacterium]|uniref:hypothetical protein n=1 Tax=Maricaulis alexandrii TaxID=2570354 RepID=UPI001107A73E|nr:hypothetical protein [Maricaulis alexandrii]MCR9266494.1 hypothetical protein [Alphaproteobacteria bacterium]
MITRNLGFAIGYAVLIILAALAATAANDQGWIPDDMPDRVMGIIAGLTVAVFSNPVAKRLPGEAAKPGQAAFKRFFARTMVLAGLGHSLVWLFAPIGLAAWIAIAVIVAGFVLIAARALFKGTGAAC